jgi:phospholipid transport system substrate-binding protein
LLLPLLFFGIAAPVVAGELTDQMKQTADEFISVLNDSTLKDFSKAEERDRLIRKIVNGRFDWEEMASRSLSRYWGQRTEEEKREFVHLYAGLVERMYVKKVVEGYSGEQVAYEGENVAGTYGTLKIRILTKKDADILLEYMFRKAGDKWLIYDIAIEGVSMVGIYRAQFNSIMSKVPYAGLVRMLRDKEKGM